MNLLIWLLLAALSLTLAQSDDGDLSDLAIAAIGENDTVWVNGETYPAPEIHYHDLAWSEDGRYLAYVAQCGNLRCAMRLDTQTGAVEQVVDEMAVWFPVVYADHPLLYVKPNFEAAYGIDLYYGVHEFFTPVQHDIYHDDTVIGSFVYQAECQGGPPDWAFVNLSRETGRNGNSQQFALTPYGILHSISCSGVGTALLDLETGESTPLGTDLSRTVISSDGRYVAGIDDDRLTIVDLETGELQIIETAQQPEQVAWGDESTIYYSTIEAADEIVITEEEEEILRKYWFYAGTNVITNAVTIRRYDLQSGDDSVVYTADAYAIGRMAVTPDGLLFSQIPNLNDWITIGLGDTVDETALRESIATRLYHLKLDSGTTELIDIGLYRFVLKPD